MKATNNSNNEQDQHPQNVSSRFENLLFATNVSRETLTCVTGASENATKYNLPSLSHINNTILLYQYTYNTAVTYLVPYLRDGSNTSTTHTAWAIIP